MHHLHILLVLPCALTKLLDSKNIYVFRNIWCLMHYHFFSKLFFHISYMSALMLFPIFFIVMQMTSKFYWKFPYLSFFVRYSLQVSRWRWLKLLLQGMQESSLLLLISAHARMVYSSSRNAFTRIFSVFKCSLSYLTLYLQELYVLVVMES